MKSSQQTLMRALRSLPLAAGIALLVIAGCSGQAVNTEPVEGIVTLDGEPVEGATLTFIPVQPGSGAAATGITDAEGKYRLTAVDAGPEAEAGTGTMPGEYYVGVLKNTAPDIVPASEMDPDQLEKSDPDEMPEEVTLTYVVPQKFNDPRTSGIKKTVQAGANDIPIELKSK